MPSKAVLFAAGAVVCGIVAFVLHALEGSRLAVRKHNISVEGSILRSWTTSRKGNVRHWVNYEYSIDGAAFKVEERAVKGPLGGRIRVWYDPASPGDCVSDPELRHGRDIGFVFALAVLGVVCLVGVVREWFRRPPPAIKA